MVESDVVQDKMEEGGITGEISISHLTPSLSSFVLHTFWAPGTSSTLWG